MSTGGREFFDQFLGDYFMESEEHLTSARNRMLELESAGVNRPVDTNVLDELLRDFHSLKGLSAMVGLEDATQLAHHIEDYLKELKRPNTVISAQAIESVLAGISAIEQVIEAKRKSSQPPNVATVLVHLDAAAEVLRGVSPSETRTDTAMWRALFRSSPESAAKGLTVTTVRGQLERAGEVVQAAPQVLKDGGLAFEFIVSSTASEDAFASLRAQGVEFSRIAATDSVATPVPESESVVETQASVAPATNAIRVDMHRLDEVMRLVGELVISRFRLHEVLRAGNSSDWGVLEEINLSMERQLRDLREGVMSIRMVPIGQVFDRMRFVARGLERELNKRVDLRIEGQDTEIDKLIVERMMDPLLHLVRNAISHGLESPHERKAVGKPEIGTVRLSAKPSGDTVLIEVEDDGRGLDVQKIAKRAEALGLIAEGESLAASRLLDIICAPDFTTRDSADLASGRGVGMTAVQEAVNALGGSIALTTNAGKGTSFAIRLPLTLLIADALMVAVDTQRFAIPLTAVREVLAVEQSTIKAFENNEAIPFRSGVLPILRLARIFGLPREQKKRLHVLIIEHAGSPTGLAVDRIIGQREIVVRSITDPLVRVPGVVGATELGDGRPVLILDPYSLIRSALSFDTVEVS